MRAPTQSRSRRYPIIDEVENPHVLPPLDRPFDSILTTRTRLRTHFSYERVLSEAGTPRRHLLHHIANPFPSAGMPPRVRTMHRSRKSCDDDGGGIGIGTAQPIRVEILSCDGGSLDFDDSGRYNAENLLLDNISVYCTAKLENVNILLRGAGSRPFTLSRIEIKAPQRSFTSPVKDGLVFVSMDRINVSDTRMYDRGEHSSHQEEEEEDETEEGADMHEAAGAEDNKSRTRSSHSDLLRLLEGHALPHTTTQLDDPSIPTTCLRPHAYFVVDERLGTATVVFEPAVSGRYVHVKLLSGQPFDSYPGRFERDNIDIQAILLYGYGRRVFPTYQAR